MEAESSLKMALQEFIDLLPDEKATHAISWIVTASTVRTLVRLILEWDNELVAPIKLLEALLENGWRLAGNEGTALHRSWAILSDKLRTQIREAAEEARSCAFIHDLRCRDHLGDVASDEPTILDKPSRIQRAVDAAERVERLGNLQMVPLTESDACEVLEYARLAHTDKYVSRQLAALDRAEESSQRQAASVFSGSSHRESGGDTQAARGTRQAVVSSLQCVLRGVDAVLKGEHLHPFCCVRPPGHHVGRDGRTHEAVSQGFCFFNNVGIAAKYAVDHLGLKRVAVIDFDVHHGNGTQEILSSDSRFFFVSTHVRSAAFYPCTGHEEGQPAHVSNVDLAKGFEFSDLLAALADEQVEQKLCAFQPELIILSSGFDAHKTDPSRGARLETNDFYELTQRFISLAWRIESCHGRLLSVLEGGYDVKAGGGLQSSIEAHMRALSRKDPPKGNAPVSGSKRRR